jgi:alpha-beta hydrolase superfamily lysophospholipase
VVIWLGGIALALSCAAGIAAAAAGFSVYVPDLRGHGADGRLGDIDYLGQLDDDLADLIEVVRREHPQAAVTLVGPSSHGPKRSAPS